MISANTFQWTLCPLGHFLALIVQCRIHGTSFESLMEALSRSLFWNHFFVFFSGHPQALTKVTSFLATTSNHFGRLLLSIAWFDFLWSIDHGLHINIAYMIWGDVITWWQYSLWAHLTGSGSESSLPEVSSVVASGRVVVISIGMESTAPSATRRQPRNFSISPARQCRYNQSLSRCQGIAGESRQPEERYLPCVSTHARGWLVRTKGARERVDLYSRQEMAHA